LGKWWVGQRWHWKEFAVLSIGVVHFIALVSPFLGFLRRGGRFLGLGDGAWATGSAVASLVLLLLLLSALLSLARLLALVGLRVIFLGRFTALALTAVVPLLGVSVTTVLLLLLTLLLLSLLFSGVAVVVLLEDVGSSEGVLELALTLELLFLGVESVSQIVDLLWVLNLLNLAGSFGDLLKGQVLDGVGEDLFFESVSAVGLFVLNNVQDGVLFAIATASQEAGVDGTFPDGSNAVVTEARVEETSRGGESEDWLVLAGGEVDGFHNLVDLISLLAESLESLWPWDFSLEVLVAVFSGSGVLSLSQLLVGGILLEVLVVLVSVGLVFLRALFAAALGLLALGVLLFGAGAGVVIDWLSLSLELEWSVEGSVLADSVVSLAFTMNGLFHGLIEESGFLVGVVWANLVGSAVQVASNDDIDASGVQDEMGYLSFLHVDSPGWETAIDLDGVDDALSHSHFNGRLEVFLELSLDLNWVLVLKDSVSPATIDFGVNLDSFEVDWLQVDCFWSDNGQLHLVFNLESGVLSVLAESSENTSTNIVSVGVSHFPGVVGGDVPCKAERD
jgi:hypothetical protein